MEYKIGEIFEYNEEWYQCVEGTGCYKCCFNFNEDTCTAENPHCTCRSDKKNVIFKKLEKVGEPFIGKVHIQLQRYKIYTEPIIDPAEKIGYVNEKNTIAIEIKQNKEDMKENNDGNTPLNELTDKYVNGNINYDEFEKEVKALYSCKKDMEENKVQHYDCFFDKEQSKSNLKPFDLEAAKTGKPVCTRDGRKARIICFDRVSYANIVALIRNDKGKEEVHSYFSNGQTAKNTEYDYDLMMLPEKHERWVNVYKVANGYELGKVFPSEDEAKNGANIGCISTVKIEWEEY